MDGVLLDHISFTGLLAELVAITLLVVRVQKLLGFLAAGLTKVILVERLDFGIEVAHTESRLLVVGVETGRTRGTNLIRREAGLTAAANATTAASHDFDEIVARLDAVLEILANLIENLLDVPHLMRDGNIVEQGNHETLLYQKGFYAELYNSQFAVS